MVQLVVTFVDAATSQMWQHLGHRPAGPAPQGISPPQAQLANYAQFMKFRVLLERVSVTRVMQDQSPYWNPPPVLVHRAHYVNQDSFHPVKDFAKSVRVGKWPSALGQLNVLLVNAVNNRFREDLTAQSVPRANSIHFAEAFANNAQSMKSPQFRGHAPVIPAALGLKPTMLMSQLSILFEVRFACRAKQDSTRATRADVNYVHLAASLANLVQIHAILADAVLNQTPCTPNA